MANLLRRMKDLAQEVVVMLESGGATRNSPALLHHFRAWDARSTREKSLFCLRLGIKKITEDPENARALFELGAQYLILGKLKKGEAMLKMAVLLKDKNRRTSFSPRIITQSKPAAHVARS